MKRLLLVAVIVALTAPLLSADPALGVADDDIPGVALGGATISNSVNPGSDRHDIFSIVVGAGQEIHVDCTTKAGSVAKGAFRLLTPSTPSMAAALAEATTYQITKYSMSSYTSLYTQAEFAYVAARAGTYYLAVEGTEGTLSYELEGGPTGRAPITTADTDDIPGVPLGLGSITGIVDTLVDRNDLYRVKLFAGQPVQFRLVPAHSDNTWGGANLALLTPDSTSIASYSTYDNAVGYQSAHTAYNGGSDTIGVLAFTPTTTGVYHLKVSASSVISNFPYTVEVTGSAALPGSDPPPPPPDDTAFPDVGAGHPYRAAIEGMYDRGIISGYGSGLFGPNDSVKRAQFAKMIVGTMGLQVYEGMFHPFTDLGSNPAGDLYPHDYIAAAFANGITNGITPTSFGPYVAITRAQVVTMIVRAVGMSVLTSPPGGYGGSVGDFSATHTPYMRIAEYNGLLAGLQGFGPGWDPWQTASRGECAQILWNLLTR